MTDPGQEPMTVEVVCPRKHFDDEGRSPTEREMRCDICRELYVAGPGTIRARLRLAASGEREREEVTTDDGTVVWRIGDAVAPLDSIECRIPGHPDPARREWHVVYGKNSVAVSIERIQAWASLLRSRPAQDAGEATSFCLYCRKDWTEECGPRGHRRWLLVDPNAPALSPERDAGEDSDGAMLRHLQSVICKATGYAVLWRAPNPEQTWVLERPSKPGFTEALPLVAALSPERERLVRAVELAEYFRKELIDALSQNGMTPEDFYGSAAQERFDEYSAALARFDAEQKGEREQLSADHQDRRADRRP